MNKFLNFRSRKGFTLIELLVVIAILSILITGIIVLIDPPAQLRKARDASRKSDLRQIQSALEMYRSDQGDYPLTASFPNCGSPLTGGTQTYIQRIPCDPKNTGQLIYTYTSTVSTTTYTLVACLENVNDSQKDTTSVSPCDTTGVNNWSYTLQNP